MDPQNPADSPTSDVPASNVHACNGAADVWLVGASPLTARIAAALQRAQIAASQHETAPPGVAVVLIDCTSDVQRDLSGFALACCAVPNAVHVAVLPDAAPTSVLAAFSAGAADFVALNRDPTRSVDLVAQHVLLILSRLGRHGSGEPVALPMMPDPVVATSATPDPGHGGATGLSCAVTTRGRVLRWSPSMAPFIANAAPGASFFELVHAADRPAVRNAALLLMAGEAAVDISARMLTGGAPVRWHLVMHPDEKHFLALGILDKGGGGVLKTAAAGRLPGR